ncbi:MAG: Uma2 family endonuclease [Cyanobacteria bacterium CRU_2_1]|nr:Uma2 family endonuclease [Cyanobacteria bacterium RU_5_0]NJR59986.1 Uma2 family endonuclease [Cyanobacteria bacterium CRU_2_1]
MSTVQRSILPDNQDMLLPLPPCDLYSDEPPLETDLHLQQIILFLECLNWWWRDRDDFYASGNLTIYYSLKQLKNRDFRGPDFFVVLGVERRSRKSWMVWEEDGKTPNVVIEILSESTANIDRTTKKQIYQNTLKIYDYFWFDPDSLEFAGFSLVNGQYQPLPPTAQGCLWSEQLQLFLGIHDRKLRFFTPEGQLIPTPTEAALAEQQQREQAEQRAERLAAKLRELNIDPDAL